MSRSKATRLGRDGQGQLISRLKRWIYLDQYKTGLCQSQTWNPSSNDLVRYTFKALRPRWWSEKYFEPSLKFSPCRTDWDSSMAYSTWSSPCKVTLTSATGWFTYKQVDITSLTLVPQKIFFTISLTGICQRLGVTTKMGGELACPETECVWKSRADSDDMFVLPKWNKASPSTTVKTWMNDVISSQKHKVRISV